MDSPTSDSDEIDPMSNYVEYGDDYIDAGPTSFPKDESLPSAEEMLLVQNLVETVCFSDFLVLDRQNSVNGSAGGVNSPIRDTVKGTTVHVNDARHLDLDSSQADTVCLGLVPQLPSQANAPSDGFSSDLEYEMTLISGQNTHSPSSPFSPKDSPQTAGQV